MPANAVLIANQVIVVYARQRKWENKWTHWLVFSKHLERCPGGPGWAGKMHPAPSVCQLHLKQKETVGQVIKPKAAPSQPLREMMMAIIITIVTTAKVHLHYDLCARMLLLIVSFSLKMTPWDDCWLHNPHTYLRGKTWGLTRGIICLKQLCLFLSFSVSLSSLSLSSLGLSLLISLSRSLSFSLCHVCVDACGGQRIHFLGHIQPSFWRWEPSTA